jgi:hypothetical protein
MHQNLALIGRDADLIAVDLAEDDATRARYMSAAAAAKVGQDEQDRREKMSVFELAESALSFAATYDKYVKDGRDPEKEGLVSASTAVFAWTMLDKAFIELDEKLCVRSNAVCTVDESASAGTSRRRARSRRLLRVPLSTLQVRIGSRTLLETCLTFSFAADAIITDARGFHLPTGKSHELPLSEKLRLQLAWDSKVLDLDQWIEPNVVPRDVIRHYDERVKREGWAKCVCAC